MKSDLNYGDLNFIEEDINLTNIYTELFKINWAMRLINVNTEKIYIINEICLEICKNRVLLKKKSRIVIDK